MASLLTGYDALEITTEKVSVTIKGIGTDNPFNKKELEEKQSTLKLSCKDHVVLNISNDDMVFNSANTIEYKTTPLFFEQKNYEVVIVPKTDNVSFWNDNFNIRKSITPISTASSILTGIINFRNDIGYSDLVIRIDGKDYLRITIEVFPSKISYQNDYKAIIADVTAEVYDLAFDFLKRTYDTFNLSSTGESSQIEFFSIVRHIYKDFIRAIDVVIEHPHHVLQTTSEVVPSYKVKKVNSQSVKWASKHQHLLSRKGDSIYAEKMLNIQKQVTYNTNENQFLKFMLSSISRRLVSFKDQFYLYFNEREDYIIDEINRMNKEITGKVSSSFLSSVDLKENGIGNSLVFAMAPGYRDVYKYYLMLLHGLSISGDLFQLSMKDLAILYEYWCFIKLNHMMRDDRYELVSQDIIRLNGNGMSVSLVKGARSRVVYRNKQTNEKIVLSYNPKEVVSPTGTQRPDNVLSLQKNGTNTKYEYVFDAKYKINSAKEGTDYYRTIAQTPGPEIADINTMHRYRDAIVYGNEANNRYERKMFGAYILFPYDNEEEYKNHKFYKSIESVNIGGLPFLPSATSLVKNLLDELIIESSNSAFERTTLPAGIEEKLAKVDWSHSDVLVGTLRNREQLQVILENGFYHVPVAKVNGDSFPIRYIAIYQSKHLFGSDAGITYYGEVTSSRIVRRCDIKEIPKNSDELYYRFEVKNWLTLSRNITPKEKGFVCEYTNLFLLLHSKEIPELLIRSEEEYRLLSELKRRINAIDINANANGSLFTVGKTKIALNNGYIDVITDSVTEHFLIGEFNKRPGATFRKIYEIIHNGFE